jgi:hypothetical protein
VNEKVQELLQLIKDHQAIWLGAAIATMPTAWAVIKAFPRELLSGESFEALEFYQGKQWPQEILEIRSGRPCLVENRLPELVAAALDSQRHDGLPELSALELTKLRVIITLQNRDAQLFYNYVASSCVELLSKYEPVKSNA